MYTIINCDKAYEENVQGILTGGHNLHWYSN